MCSEVEEELAYVVLEDDDERDDSHRHQFVEYGAQEPHLENLRHEEPHDDEDEYAYEGIE